jgi:general secretion pathway protein D
MDKMPKKSPLLRIAGRTATLAVLLVLTLGCSLHRARKAFDEGRYDEAVKAYRDILQNSPTNVSAKIGLRRASSKAAEIHLDKAREAQRRGQDDQVYLEVRKAVVLDPANAVATDWITNLEMAAQRKKLQQDAEDNLETQRAKADLRPAVMLNPRSIEGMDLNFTRRTPLKEIFSVLSNTSGVNIILHTSFQDAQISADLRGLSFQRVLDTLMIQNDLLYKVLDTNTIMVFKNTPQFKDQFENQLIKTFYLSNADPNDVRSIFQQLMPQLKVFTDKRLNAVTIKAKPQELTIARRIVSQLDKAKAEVMVYLELLEVTENNMEQVGLLPVLGPSDGINGGSGIYRIGGTIDNTGGPNENKGAIRISKSDVRFLFPNLALDALKSSGDAKLLASPNIRVVSDLKGEINIGEKISTTQSSISGLGGTSGSTSATSSYLNGASQTQYSYEDVGVKITVEPRVHFNDDITIKIKSEVKTLKSGSTAGRPDLGQRIIETSARLKDGETAVFAGLLKEEEQKSLQGIWGVSDIPVIGKLLGSNRSQRAKTDVLLTIRAVIVRKPDIQAEDWEAFDPDFATSQTGPFIAKPKSNPVTAGVAESKMGLAQAPVAPTPAPTTPETPAVPPKEEATAAPKEPEENGLVIFLAPVFAPLVKGERVQISLLVSNGKGLTSGSMELRIDPKLKLVSAAAGDFLTSESGSLEQDPSKDGLLKLSFKRTGSASDSGTLAILELEGTATGNAPVLVQSGRYMVGPNPVSARVLNSLITVE